MDWVCDILVSQVVAFGRMGFSLTGSIFSYISASNSVNSVHHDLPFAREEIWFLLGY